MKVLVTSAAFGQPAMQDNIKYLHSVADTVEMCIRDRVNTDVAELDITDIDKVMELAREVKPYAILNCAAFTNVNGCETAGDIVWKINALGPLSLIHI